jgi:signal transduction histidine kinase
VDIQRPSGLGTWAAQGVRSLTTGLRAELARRVHDAARAPRDASKAEVIPEYPPRVRLEWLIASSRIVLAAGALLAVAVSPSDASSNWPVAYALSWYLIYSLLVLALVWTPVRFAAGWGIAQHAFDLAAFAIFSLFTDPATGPFVTYFTFLVICGSLRWEWRGALWTALLTAALYTCTAAYAAFVVGLRPFELNTLLLRLVHLLVVAVLVGYLGAHHHRFQRELGRVVAWPRRAPRQPHELAAELVRECSETLEAPRVLIVWEEPEDGSIQLASGAGMDVSLATEPEATYGSFVISNLERRTFQAKHANDEKGRVVYWSAGSFRQRIGRPVHQGLQARFNIERVQSWSLDGELVRGRLFALDKRHMRLDDLIFGDIVARLAVTKLDGLYLQRRLGKAAALEERLRLARDIHDSLLQSAAASALQLVAARRLLDHDPARARDRLADVQNQLEHGELEMRTFIRRLRPAAQSPSESPAAGLGERLEDLRRRVERQWEIAVRIRVPDGMSAWPEPLADDIYRIVQEGVLNAARHADPSIISVAIAVEGARLHLTIADDGRGFPFLGTYDLDALNAMNEGPLTLKERVAELRGALELRSSESGTELSIALPLTPALA